MNQFSFAYAVAGLCFFLFGIHMTEQAMRQVAGDQLRSRIAKLTRYRLSAFFLGAVMTLVFQSSTATTSMLVGLASIGYLSAKDAIAVVLGADVGTTVFVLLLALLVRFDVSTFSLSILILGFAATFLVRSGRPRFVAEAILGFGFLFFGLTVVSQASAPLRDSGLFREVIAAIAGNSLAAAAFAAIVAGLIQSSAAVIGVILSFAAIGLLTPIQAVPFVLGANIGSAVGPLLASMKAQAEGKRVAYVHVGSKIVGVLVVLPFSEHIASAAARFSDAPSMQVATVHILFNFGLASAFLPFTSILARMVTRLVPAPDAGHEFGPKYLDLHALDSPTLAFSNVFREILRMAEIAQEMCAQALSPFEEVGHDSIDRLEEMDDQIDRLDREIKFYMAKIAQEKLTPEQAQRELELLMLTHDLESVGDVVCKDLLELAEKKQRKQVRFSQEGWDEIKGFHAKVMENFHLAVTSFASGNIDLGKTVVRHKKHLGVLEQELGQKHLMRLHQGLRESFETSSLHLDILSNLRRINSLVSKMAYPVLDRRSA